MVPTENKRSFKQYIKDKPVKWGLRPFLFTDNGMAAFVRQKSTQEREPMPTSLMDLGRQKIGLCA